MIAGIDISSLIPSIAAKLAHMGAEDQAGFLNVFAIELESVCDTTYNAEVQAVAVKGFAGGALKRFCATICYEER